MDIFQAQSLDELQLCISVPSMEKKGSSLAFAGSMLSLALLPLNLVLAIAVLPLALIDLITSGVIFTIFAFVVWARGSLNDESAKEGSRTGRFAAAREALALLRSCQSDSIQASLACGGIPRNGS